MHVDLLSWNDDLKSFDGLSEQSGKADIVLFFGNTDVLREPYLALREAFSDASLIGCSSAGQILNNSAFSYSFAAAAISFSHTRTKCAEAFLENSSLSYDCGSAIGKELKADDLSGVLLLSDGTNVNGSFLVSGLTDSVGEGVTVVGGLAADGTRFGTTLVGVDVEPREKTVAAVGLYGDRIKFGYGSEGGWTPFGPKRVVTKSDSNILYEMDGKPALDLYIKYLGKEAEDLPGSALFFPLAVSDPHKPDDYVVRTILSIDQDEKSMTFAGALPEGSFAQFMRVSYEGLSSGAAEAARQAKSQLPEGELAFLVSCVGRSMVLGQQVEDELDAVASILPTDIPKIGFYSYGEICPNKHSKIAKLHNETMTVTVMSEI